MYRYVVVFLLCLSCVLCAWSGRKEKKSHKKQVSYNLQELPAPYCYLRTVLPFSDFGWYTNDIQLQQLIQTHSIHTVIEIGSFMGKSTRHIASCLPEGGIVYAIDHWKGSEEHQPGGGASQFPVPLSQLYESFLSNVIHAGLTHKIHPIQQESLVAAQDPDLKAELIYIDAGHDTESVYKDLIAWFPHLTPQGILCGDDWLWPTVEKAVRQFADEHPELHLEYTGNFYYFLPK